MKQPAERAIPIRRRIAVTWVGFAPARLALRDTDFCGQCGKLALPSAEAARGYIALLMRSGQLTPATDTFDFAPYLCPHLAGMWHAGHNRKTVELLQTPKPGPKEKTCHETEKKNSAGRR